MKCPRIADYLIEKTEVHVLQAQLALQLLRQVLQLLLLRQGCYLLRRHSTQMLCTDSAISGVGEVTIHQSLPYHIHAAHAPRLATLKSL